MLQVKNLTFQYPKSPKPLFQDLQFSLGRGSSAAIVGPSGSGKSTLFQLLTGALSGFEGNILLNGLPINPSLITYMMQKDLLLSWKTVYENVLLIEELGEKNRESKGDALELIERVGLIDVLHQYPKNLSFGMRQRASLARALFRRRPFLFLDEAFSSVDPYQKKELHALVLEEQSKYAFTLLVITHDLEEAYSVGKTVYFLSEGMLHQAPSKELFHSFFMRKHED